jgi:hypothetical protein
VSDDLAVLRLEASVLPRVEGLEALRASLATRLETTTEAVSRMAKR